MGLTELRLAGFKRFGEPVAIPLAPLTIVIGQNGSGKSTLPRRVQIATRLRRTRQKLKYEAATEAWLVCDVEDRLVPSVASVARRQKGTPFLSSPCLELSFLAHFHEQHARLDQVEARRMLQKHLPRYVNAKVRIGCGKLSSAEDVAARRAAKLPDPTAVSAPNPAASMGPLITRLRTPS